MEREDALAEAARSAGLARAGQGGWLRLHGDTGTGRSALLAEIVRRESADGRMRTLRAHAAPAETQFAYSLARLLLPEAEWLPFGEPSRTGEQGLFHRLTECLAGAAARQPLLLAVDDIHYADAASLRWIAYLSHRLARLPVLLVLTACTGPDHCCRPAFPFGTGPTPHPGAGSDIPLPPLGPESVDRLLAGKGLHGAHARRAAALGMGNPALLHALPVVPATGTPGDPAAGARYRAALAHWLHSPATPERRLIALALVLLTAIGPEPGSGPDPILVAATAGLATDQATPHRLAELTPLLTSARARQAVLATAANGELGQFRRRLAHALHEHGRPAPDIARVLLELPQTGDPWITHTLDEAAEDALRTNDLEHAARILRHALTGPLDPAHHCTLTMRLSSLDMLHSARAGTRRLRESLRRTDCHDPYAVSEALSSALATQGRVRNGVQIMEETGRALEDDQLAGILRVAAAGLATQGPQGWHRAAHELRELSRSAPASAEPFLCALLTLREGGTGQLDAHTAAERIISRLDRPVDPRLSQGFASIAATVLAWADRQDQARALIERELPALPAPVDLTNFSQQQLIAALATVDRGLGRHRQLIGYTAPLLESVLDPAVRLPHLRALTAQAWHELGSPERARRQLDALGPRPDNAAWTWDEVLYTQASLHLAAGRWSKALDTYLTCGATPTNRDFVNPVRQPWRIGAVIALTHLGRHTEARALAEENTRHARAWGTPRLIGTALRCHAITQTGHSSRETLLRAVSVLRTAPAPVELIEAMTDLGRVQITHGQTGKGQATLLEALHLARSLTHPPANDHPVLTSRLVATIERLLREHGTRPRAGRTECSPLLTATERRIADLAVQGMTNAEICSLLHLARRTVETHLTKVYRKLGITRRTQLAAHIGGAPMGQSTGTPA